MKRLGWTAAVLACVGSALPVVAVGAPATSFAATPPAVRQVSQATQATQAGPVVLGCVGEPQTRPGTYLLACGDGNNYLTSLHWSQWGAKGARAVGTDVANDCLPYCAAGHFHDYPAVVTLTGAEPWKGHPGVERFTRLTLEYPGARPTGVQQQLSYTLPAGPV